MFLDFNCLPDSAIDNHLVITPEALSRLPVFAYFFPAINYVFKKVVFLTIIPKKH